MPALSSDRRQEQDTVELARQGDKQAISELYRCCSARIYHYVRMRVPDRSVAEDVTAQVFLEALQNLPRYEPTGAPFLVWLYRIARTQVADYWRKQKRCQEVTLTDRLPAPGLALVDLFQDEADWSMAVDLLAELTDNQQNVLVLRSMGGMSLAATAAALGKSVGAVKALERRARASLARLRQGLSPYPGSEQA